MIKRFRIFFILIMVTFIVGCSNNNSKISLKHYSEKPISFNIQKISLSKGFQNIEQEIQASKKDNKIRLFLSLGVVDCSEIKVKEVKQKNNDINIYIEKISDNKSSLNVPQIVMNLSDKTIDNYENMNFNIINENYTPILLKFNKGDIIKKLSSDFNITPINLPIARLDKLGEKIVWHVDFYPVINNESPDKELINLYTVVDANTGKILESISDNVGSKKFDGQLLDYMPEKNLLIKDNHTKDNIEYTDLYTYNEGSKEKTTLFSTKGDIMSASLSHDGNHIAFIEALHDSTNLYTVSIDTRVATKVNPLENVNPRLIKWSNDNMLYILDNDNNKSEIHLYNIMDNTNKSVFKGEFPLCDFDINGDRLLILKSSDHVNKDIYYKDNKRELAKVSFGSKVEFINDDTIILLEGSETSDKTNLLKYDIDSGDEILISNKNVGNFKIDNENNLFYSCRDNEYNNYIVNRYNLEDHESKPVFHMINEDIFINYKEEYIYITLPSPDDIDDKNIYKVFYKE